MNNYNYKTGRNFKKSFKIRNDSEGKKDKTHIFPSLQLHTLYNTGESLKFGKNSLNNTTTTNTLYNSTSNQTKYPNQLSSDIKNLALLANRNIRTKQSKKEIGFLSSIASTDACMAINKTLDHFNTTTSAGENNLCDIDEEMGKLKHYYYDLTKKGYGYDRIKKHEVLKKYNINNTLSEEELKSIEKVFKFSGSFKENTNNSNPTYNRNSKTLIHESTINTSNTGNNTNRTTTQLNKTFVKFLPEEFKDPTKSLKKLKLNKQIHDNIMQIITSKQAKLYIDKFENAFQNNIKLEKMPIPTVRMDMLNSKLKEKMLEEEAVSGDNFLDTNNDGKYNNTKKEMMNKIYQSLLSRDDILAYTDYHGSYGNFSQTRPSARSQTSMTYVEQNNSFIIIGGVNSRRLLDFWVCNYDGKTLSWKQLKTKGEEVLPRMGHTAVHFRNKIFIYGGNVEDEAEMPKEDVCTFSLESHVIKTEKCYNKKDVPWRRNHIAECVGYHMLIHGGISEYGEFLADCYMLDLISYVWTRLEPKGSGYKPIGVAHHSSSFVITSDKRQHSQFHIFKYPDMPRMNTNKIKHEGIYIFGGIDKDGNCNNEIRIIKVGKRPLEWIKPDISGMPPVPRCSASISFYEEMEVLILHGGKNNKDSKLVYDDFYILDLHNLTWIKVNIFDKIPKPRSEHCSLVMFNKLILFGGINAESFVGSEFFLVNLDYFQNKKKKVENNNYKMLYGELIKKSMKNNDSAINSPGVSSKHIKIKTVFEQSRKNTHKSFNSSESSLSPNNSFIKTRKIEGTKMHTTDFTINSTIMNRNDVNKTKTTDFYLKLLKK
jgi:hypothetical protein